jgi:hypothetical protein
MYIAGVVAVNSKVVGLAPDWAKYRHLNDSRWPHFFLKDLPKFA